MSEIVLRRMKIEDADQLPEINEICGLSPWKKDSFINEANNILADYFVLEAQDRIIGYAGMWCVIDEAEIMNVAVLPEFRGKGFGKMLMAQMITTAQEKNCTSMILEVKKNNTAALNLYAHQHFVVYDTRKRYYHDGTDALLMRKELTTPGNKQTIILD